MSSEILELLQNGADANTSDPSGFTLLMTFAKQNDIEAMQYLLDYAAEINTKDILGLSAIDYAIKNHHLEAVRFLVENGANVSGDSYMFALDANDKPIIDYFDSLDPNKYVFLKDKKYRYR